MSPGFRHQQSQNWKTVGSTLPRRNGPIMTKLLEMPKGMIGADPEPAVACAVESARKTEPACDGLGD